MFTCSEMPAMHTIFRTFIAAAALLTAAGASAFSLTADSTSLHLSRLDVAVDEAASTVSIDLSVDASAYRVPSDRQILFTPVLISADGTDSLQLSTITIAGRNQWYHYLRNGFLDDPEAHIYRAGQPANAAYHTTVDLLPWMEHSTLEMRAATANCCDAPVLMHGPSVHGMVPMATIDVHSRIIEAPVRFAPPVDAGPVTRSIEGSAFVTFVVNRTELKPDYMNNPAELQKIINSIEYVRRDTDATITRVHIKGFASPEGPYMNNVRLAQGRTETLRRYVRDLYRFPDTIVTSDYQPEDWAGLRTWVTDSMSLPISNRAGILAIIDGDLDYDERNAAIKAQYPADYAVILRDVYPWLRHSDYAVRYTIKTYTTLEEIRRVYASDPTRLRNVDFYTLAQSYPIGSPDYCRVFEKAVEVYPDDKMLNLNAANIAIEADNFSEARRYLNRAGDSPLADYARGVLAGRMGKPAEMVELLTAASEGGIDGLAPYIDAARQRLKNLYVTYHITPENNNNNNQ